MNRNRNREAIPPTSHWPEIAAKSQTPELPDSMVKVVMSSCPECKGAVRVAVEHKADMKDFYKEVIKYGLIIEVMSLRIYNKSLIKWCDCKPENPKNKKK